MAMHIFRRLVQLPLSAFVDSSFMKLAVALSRQKRQYPMKISMNENSDFESGLADSHMEPPILA
jgi:hypothetical protein